MPKFKLESKRAEIKQMFQNGMSVESIAKKLNEYPQTVSNLLRSEFPNIKFRPDKGNVHYFDVIDSYAKAYIVGFIAADGALVKTKTTTTLTITIKYEDKAVLEFIKSEIGNTHKLQEIKRVSSYNPEKQIHHIRYTLSDNNITIALNKLGITTNKSLTMTNIIDNIPYKFRDAFIIGYFDGDGSISIRDGQKPNSKNILCYSHSLYIQIRGTKNFLEGICNHLGISLLRIHKNDSIPHLSFSSKKDVVRFFICYNNLPFYYKRKYDVFLKRINHPSFAKYKQDQTISSFTK